MDTAYASGPSVARLTGHPAELAAKTWVAENDADSTCRCAGWHPRAGSDVAWRRCWPRCPGSDRATEDHWYRRHRL